jgi:hypothetical protein
MAVHQPNLFIHLGDIYYAGTKSETETFLALRDQHLPGVRTFTLAGNHDMYGGGKPYYALLKKLDQPASFFALRNADWQLLGMDTGYNDYDPYTVSKAVTHLRDDEWTWQLDKINNNGGRKTVLLSHHPLFSGTGIHGKPLNDRLHGQFASVLDKIDLWAWGHEHSHVLFAPYAGLQRGRCMGAGAIPVPITDNPYSNASDANLTILAPRIGADPSGAWYDCAYAILNLTGPAGKLSHYALSKSEAIAVEDL